MKFKIITLVFLLSSSTQFAQKETPHHKAARIDYDNFNYQKTIQSLERLENKDVDVKRKLAYSYDFLADYSNAELYYSAICSTNERVPDDVIAYAKVLMKNQKYSEAQIQLAAYAQMNPVGWKYEEFNGLNSRLAALTDKCKGNTIQNLPMNSEHQDFSPYVLNDQLYFTSTRTPSNLILRKWNGNNMSYLDVYCVKYLNGSFGDVNMFDEKKVNDKYHDGPIAFSKDGTEMFITRSDYSNHGKDGVKNLRLLVARKQANGWSEPEVLPFNSTEYNVGHATISADGNTLIFASDMPGGMGGVDLYRVTKDASGWWSVPENLVHLNTNGNEMFPYLHEEGYLLFSSNGHFGYGGMDVYVAQYKSGEIGKFYNVGAPINSNSDDFSPWLGPDKLNGFFASNRTTDNGKGSDDIFSFKLEKPFVFGYQNDFVLTDIKGNRIPSMHVCVKDNDGQIIDSAMTDENGNFSYLTEKTGTYTFVFSKKDYFDIEKNVTVSTLSPDISKNEIIVEIDPGFSMLAVIKSGKTKELLPEVKLTITNNFTGEEFVCLTKSDGTFRLPIEGKKINDRISYNIRLEKPGYLSKGTTYNRSLDKPGEYILSDELNLNLEKIEVGVDIAKAINLKPIYFDLGKYLIRTDAAIELDKIVKIMNENPTMVIELGAHTDCRGSAAKNQELSQKRAQASAEYIRARIVNPARISGRGYGESKLLNGCACEGKKNPKYTDAQHAVNRRTEFVIVKM